MKKQLLILLTVILSFNCYSQISFEEGYYIDNNDQKVKCLIKNIDWKNNPTEFEYKLSENSETKKATIASTKEFGIYNVLKYIRTSVDIDRSGDKMDDLSNVSDPVFNEEELFLKVLVEGNATLYQYVDVNLYRYFYDKGNSNIEQLIFKKYKTADNQIGENNKFKQQLWNHLKCSSFKMTKFKKLDYNKNDLVNFFVEYNSCNSQEFTNFEEKGKTDNFNLTIRPRLNNSSLTLENFDSNSADTDLETKLGFGIGVEAELILPFNKNKWALAIEPIYQSYKSEKKTNLEDVFGVETTANVDYSSIEVPITLRHYFFLNNNSKIFLNVSYIFDFNSKSSIDFIRNDGLSTYSLELETGGNAAFGLGYKHNDKYSMELRFQTPRNILDNYALWDSKYNTISIIFGYSVF